MEAGTLGNHILVEFYGCPSDILSDVTVIEQAMLEAARRAEATIINSTFHHFSPFGVSGVVVIQESHLSIHTWPEYKYAAVDIFTCGDTVAPWIAYNYLKKSLKAEYGSAMEMKRGQQRLLPKVDFMPEYQTGKKDSVNPKYERNIWFTERNENMAFSLRHTGDVLFRERSPYQKVEVIDTFEYGKMLTLDGAIMTTEKDEFVYHELISHVGMMTHPAEKKNVLVIGGGDGGVIKELTKHESLEKVTMVEIDEAVIRASKIHLPTISSAFNHPKVNLIVGDGIDFVAKAKDETYDFIIVDNTDPVGPSEGIFTEEFYKNVYRILKPNGILATQSESPHFNVNVFKEIFKFFRKIFGKENVHTYLGNVVTYPSGLWSFSYCSKGNLHPLNNLDDDKANKFSEDKNLKCYSAEVHRAAFVLPPYVKQLLKE